LSSSVSFASLSPVLKNPIRRKIILALSEHKALTYTELISAVEIKNTGKFNYHLKLLGDLIQKDASDKYILTAKGQLAIQLLQKFPETKSEHGSLRMADAALIGFAGFALTVVNPALLFGLVLIQTTVPATVIPIFPIVAMAYGLFVPSLVMWMLSVKRSNSHDFYNLFRAPLVSFVILLALIILMLLTKFTIFVEIKSPTVILAQGVNWSHSTSSATYISLVGLFMQGLVFSFLGVALVEFASRYRRKRLGKISGF